MENEGMGGAAPWPIAVIDRFRPPAPSSGRGAFQARFITGACLMGALVALAALGLSVLEGDSVASAIIGTFLATQVALLAAMRGGAPIRVLIWLALGVVGVFLVAISLTTRDLLPEQLPWLALLPLSALVLSGPHPDDTESHGSWRPVAVALVAALAAGAFVVVAHHFGLRLDRPTPPSTVAGHVLGFTLLLGSTTGLILLHDLAARETQAELRRLRRFLSVCAWCKQIKHEDGWIPLEMYLVRRHQSDLSHGICPACLERHYPPHRQKAE